MIKAVGNYVLVEPKKQKEETSKGGVILPSKVGRDFAEGKVISIGAECQSTGMLKEGVVVVYNGYAAKDFTFDGNTLALVHKDEILAYFE